MDFACIWHYLDVNQTNRMKRRSRNNEITVRHNNPKKKLQCHLKANAKPYTPRMNVIHLHAVEL